MFLFKILDISARKGAKFNKLISEFCPNLEKVISLVTMATNVDSKLLTIVFLFLSGTDHSVKVSSNSESVRAGALLEIFGGYRELMLSNPKSMVSKLLAGEIIYFKSKIYYFRFITWRK